MFGTHFYHKLIRKYVVLFGTMFNNITLVRTNTDTGAEIERMKVPIIYGPKEKYITRLRQDPDQQKQIQIRLPRLSFEMTGISYDTSRKQNSLLKVAQPNSGSAAKSSYMSVPYDIDFELNLYTRNIDDGTQIVEQILPYFNPDYTATIDPVSSLGVLKDIPIILNSVTNNIEHEGNFDAVRFVNWTFTFTMKAHFYGPVTNPKIIRKVIANIFNDPSLQAGYVTRMNLISGNDGPFKQEDIAYQGNSYETANAYGVVLSWVPTTGKLALGAVQGQFKLNNKIRALSSNAAYMVDSFDLTPLKLAQITIEPDPFDAQPGDDYGYSTTITEYPETQEVTEMADNSYSIKMYQGTTFELSLAVKDSNGLSKNLSNYSSKMQIRTSYANTTATETLSSNTGEIVIDSSNGVVSLILSAARTAAIPVDLTNGLPPKSNYVYDLQLTDGLGKTSRLLYGNVTVFAEVTR